MARLFTSGAESQSALNGVEFDTANGTAPDISTATFRSGAASYRMHPTAATSFFTQTFMGTGANTTRYMRFYLYIATTAGANGKSIALFRDNTNGNGPIIQLNTNRSLRLYNAQGAAQIGSDSSALSLTTWYRIELSYVYSSGAVDALIDGSSFASGSTTANMDMNVTRIGVIDSDSSDLYFDDIAINDATGSFQNTWPGSGKIIRLGPNNSGDVNTFATQTGGTAGAANNYTRLDEVTPNDATDYNGSSTLNQEDLVNFDPTGIGSSDTVNVVEVWSRFRNSTADATAGIKFEIEKTGSGTILQSAELKPNSTTWRTNSIAGATFRVPPLVTYQDPDAAAWTQSTVDTAQAGYKLVTAPGTGGRRIDVSNLSLMVDYTPSSSVSTTVTQVAATVTAAGGTQVVATTNIVAITQAAGTLTATGGTQAVVGNVLVNGAVTQVAANVTAAGGTQTIATVNNVSIAQVAGVLTASGGTQTVDASSYASVSQSAATVTASGGTQVVSAAQVVTIAQVAASVTATGGTQTVAASSIASASVTQVAATVTAAGGTQVVASSQIASVTQSAATVTASGGTQVIATVNNAAITQVAANVTATGGLQTVDSANAVSITQTAANVTATGGTQAVEAHISAFVMQVAAQVTATGGTQTVLGTSGLQDASITQVAASITATGGTQVVSTATGPLPRRKYYIDSDGRLFWVLNESIGLIERV